MDRARARKNSRDLRTGFTTGANACAAACAATRLLVRGGLDPWEGPLPEATADRFDSLVGAVTIAIPAGDRVRFPVRTARVLSQDVARASVIKDAGDDPDCTHRAELWAEVRLTRHPGEIRILRGEGVGRVTRPGLGIPVGEPSITAVPRANITAEVARLLPPGLGAEVTVGIVDGEELARRTLNARLGIVGGLSILGTTGVVRPYSTAAFRASVVQAIDVAHRLGLDEVVLTTGGRSERYAMAAFPELPEQAFVQMGDFVGAALRRAAELGLRRATVVAMMGKLTKMASGTTMTHAAGSKVDTGLLADLAAAVGAPEAACRAIAEAATARRAQEILQDPALDGGRHAPPFFAALCERAALVMQAHADRHGRGRPEVRAVLVDFAGPVLGRFPRDLALAGAPPASPEVSA